MIRCTTPVRIDIVTTLRLALLIDPLLFFAELQKRVSAVALLRAWDDGAATGLLLLANWVSAVALLCTTLLCEPLYEDIAGRGLGVSGWVPLL